jgi:hypothetical protein
LNDLLTQTADAGRRVTRERDEASRRLGAIAAVLKDDTIHATKIRGRALAVLEGVARVETGCVCNGMASCEQCQERDAALKREQEDEA